MITQTAHYIKVYYLLFQYLCILCFHGILNIFTLDILLIGLTDSFDENCTEVEVLNDLSQTEKLKDLNSLNSSTGLTKFGFAKSYLLV